MPATGAGGTEPHSKVNVEELNQKLQNRFEGHSQKMFDRKAYSEASALLVDWEKEGEYSLDTKAEVSASARLWSVPANNAGSEEKRSLSDSSLQVDKLASVLEDHYNFRVRKKRLHSHNADQQMNAYLANFMCEKDSENHLLIIYYAGHGIRDSLTPGQLNLTK